MTRRNDESGVILIMVAITAFVLIALSSLAVDLGEAWYARAQAQTAADAGALAGAITRKLQEPPPATPTTLTTGAADAAARSNLIINGEGTPIVDASDEACPPYSPAVYGPCVRVDVYRDGTNDSAAFDTVFAQLYGVNTQGVRATATAQVRAATFSDCLKPWAIPDKFVDKNDDRKFELGTDVYRPPTDEDPTGYIPKVQPDGDIGVEVTLKPGSPGEAAVPSNYFEIEDANTYRQAISGCIIKKGIGDEIFPLPGNRKGPTKQGTQDLINLDPTATVDSEGVVTSIYGQNSPRIVPIALYDPTEYAALGNPPGGSFSLHIVNIVGFFIKEVSGGGDVTGVFVGATGLTVGTTPAPYGTSFLTSIQLVR